MDAIVSSLQLFPPSDSARISLLASSYSTRCPSLKSTMEAARPFASIQLACEYLCIDIDSSTLIKKSCTSKKNYSTVLRTMRSVVSDENGHGDDKVSVDGLCEKFGLKKPTQYPACKGKLETAAGVLALAVALKTKLTLVQVADYVGLGNEVLRRATQTFEATNKELLESIRKQGRDKLAFHELSQKIRPKEELERETEELFAYLRTRIGINSMFAEASIV